MTSPGPTRQALPIESMDANDRIRIATAVARDLGAIRRGLLCAFLALLAVSASSRAQEIGCEDIEFSASATAEFPSVAQSCHSVVERDGRRYVRLVADVVEVRADGSLVLDLKGRDGSRIRQAYRPPPGFRPVLSGKPASPRRLVRGQEIRLYLPEDRWSLSSGSPSLGSAE